MKGVIIFFLLIGILLLAGMLHQITAHQRSGIYPPKRILKQRAITLGGMSFIFLVIGIILAILVK